MLKKRVLTILLMMFAVMAAGGAGFIIGSNSNVVQEIEKVNTSTDAVSQTVEIKEPSTIAVVNLDDGVDVDGERIYYAEKMIRFPDTSFQYASLTEAKNGLKNGIYGAYIIIPSELSENVVSLNSTPIISEIDYTINSALSGECQYTLLYNILSFGEVLNSNLSYMYLDNVLTAFHTAQDNAATVMSNDLRDKEAIDAIRDTDLIAMVNIPELVQTNPDIAELNIDIYVEANEKCVDDIDNKYLAYVKKAEEDIANLESNGKTLSTVLDTLSAEVSEIDILKNSDGTSIKESAETELNNTLTQMSANENANIIWTESAFGTINTDADNAINTLNSELEKINNNQALELSEILASYCEDMTECLPMMVVIRNEDGTYSLTYESNKQEDSQNMSSDDVVKEYDNDIPVLTISIQDKVDNTSVVHARQELMLIIIRKMSEYNDENSVVATATDVIGVNGSMTINEIINECDMDIVVQGYLKTLGMNSVSEFLDTADNITVDDISGESEIAIDGNLETFREYSILKIKAVPTDYSLNVVDTPNTMLQLKMLKSNSSGMKEQVNNLTLMNTETVKSVFDKSYVASMEASAARLIEDNKTRYQKELDSIRTYSDQIEAFKPDYDSSFISENIGLMVDNNAQIVTAVSENNALYMKYANQVYADTSENTIALQNSIMEADKKSEEIISSGLATAKAIKEETSLQNQELLLGFSGLLPYTRLGSVEYTQAYKFITDPVELLGNEVAAPINQKIDTTKDVSKEDVKLTKKSDKAGKVIRNIVIGMLAIVIIIVVIMVSIKKKKHAWD